MNGCKDLGLQKEKVKQFNPVFSQFVTLCTSCNDRGWESRFSYHSLLEVEGVSLRNALRGKAFLMEIQQHADVCRLPTTKDEGARTMS